MGFFRRSGMRHREEGCSCWELDIHLGASGDLSPRAARSLERHLKACPACRALSLEVRKLLEACRRAPAILRESRPAPDLWPALSARIGRESSSDVLPIPRVKWRAPGGRRRILLAAAAAAAAALVLISVSVLAPFPGGNRGDGNRAGQGQVAEERWSRQWDEFVSGSEARGDLMIDPFAIPDPEVIDF